jgi:hypothetical protein
MHRGCKVRISSSVGMSKNGALVYSCRVLVSGLLSICTLIRVELRVRMSGDTGDLSALFNFTKRLVKEI